MHKKGRWFNYIYVLMFFWFNSEWLIESDFISMLMGESSLKIRAQLVHLFGSVPDHVDKIVFKDIDEARFNCSEHFDSHRNPECIVIVEGTLFACASSFFIDPVCVFASGKFIIVVHLGPQIKKDFFRRK